MQTSESYTCCVCFYICIYELCGTLHECFSLEVAEHDCVNMSTPKPSIKGVTTPVEKRLSSRPSTPAQQLSGSFRAQSATLNRPRVASTRPVRSAGVRPQTTEVTQITTPVPFALQENIANNEDTQISQLG